MRTAVIGHVEWIEFARVAAVPEPGAIVHAGEAWGEPGGGGAVSAVQLARLGGETTFFTALGDDALGHRCADALAALAPRLELVVAWRPVAQRRAFVHVDDAGERTITVIGDRQGPRGADDLPWERLEDCDAVYFTAGDPDALRRARAARTLVATARALDTLAAAGLPLDALVASANDAGETYAAGQVAPEPGLVVRTAGSAGGSWERPDGTRGEWDATPLPGPVADAYGCGDSFAAGLTHGLGADEEPGAAVRLGARCGAACLTGRGPYSAQLRA
ncbi:MAG: ribokinase [Solirubrobacterales bacterium]|nr:ribokinase [Solirubrobacterales bacterium]